MTRRRPIVLKFGGAALLEPARVMELVREGRGHAPLVLVASARKNVTNLLRRVIEGRGPPHLRSALVRLHPGLPPSATPALDRAEQLAAELRTHRDPDPALEDELLSQGERLSASWLAERLREGGVPAEPVEADRLGILTDNSYGSARILLKASERNVRRTLQAILKSGHLPVVTGFFGRSQEGRTATLGRGGSDYTATALGWILHASRVELVKRHVAIFTADPRLVPAARLLQYLSYDEAEEFAQFGAQVLHPVTIAPARAAGCQIWVRSLTDRRMVTSIGPARPGTRSRAVTLSGPLRAIRLRVPGGRQRPGIIGTLTSRLVAGGVTLAGLFTTEGEIGILVEPASEGKTREILQPLARELSAWIGPSSRVVLASAIGDGLLEELTAVRPAELAGVRGLVATPRSVSVVVPARSGRVTLRALHRAFVGRRAPPAMPRDTRAPRRSARRR